MPLPPPTPQQMRATGQVKQSAPQQTRAIGQVKQSGPCGRGRPVGGRPADYPVAVALSSLR